jgi:SNF2 family DNA or RNA helicase
VYHPYVKIKPKTMTIEELYNRAKDNFNGRLFAPYQREGVLWMLTMENQTSGPVKGGILADEMGLGKSAQLIATMLGNPKRRTLIVVPKSIITQWANEIKKFAPQLSVGVFDGPKRSLTDILEHRCCYFSLLTPLNTRRNPNSQAYMGSGYT